HLAAALHRGGAVRGPQLHRGGGGALGGVAQHEGGAVPGRGGDPQEGGLGGGFGAAREGQRAVVAGGRRGALEGVGEGTAALGGRGGGVRDVFDAGHPQHGDAEVLGGGGVLEDGAVGSFDRDGGCADGAVVLLEGGGAAHGAEQQRGRGFDGHGAQRDGGVRRGDGELFVRTGLERLVGQLQRAGAPAGARPGLGLRGGSFDGRRGGRRAGGQGADGERERHQGGERQQRAHRLPVREQAAATVLGPAARRGVGVCRCLGARLGAVLRVLSHTSPPRSGSARARGSR